MVQRAGDIMDNNLGKLLEAGVILRKYQDWRKGYDVRRFHEIGLTEKQVGEALDLVLDLLGQGYPLTDCENCRHITESGCLMVLSGKDCKFERWEE